MAGPGANLIVEKVACGAGLEPPMPIHLRPSINRKAGALGRFAASVETAAHANFPVDSPDGPWSIDRIDYRQDVNLLP